MRAAADLDHATGDPDLPVGRHLEAEPAGAADRFALVDRQALRQRRAGRQQPAAQVRARRAGTGVLDHRAVLQEEEAREHAVAFAREHVRHRARAVAAVLREQRPPSAPRGARRRTTRAGSRAARCRCRPTAAARARSPAARPSMAARSARCAAGRAMLRRIGGQRPHVAVGARPESRRRSSRASRGRRACMSSRTTCAVPSVGMPGERHLERRREDAHARGRASSTAARTSFPTG